MNPGELTIFARESGNAGARETVGACPRMEEQSYDPVVPMKVGNRRASQEAATESTGGKGGTGARIWRKET
jgi:hypothetical protein